LKPLLVLNTRQYFRLPRLTVLPEVLDLHTVGFKTQKFIGIEKPTQK